MNREDTIALQRDLTARGFGPLAVDGIYGPATAGAYARLIQISDAGGIGHAMPVPAAAKPWWTSRALIGSLATVILSVVSMITGLSIDAGAVTDALYALLTAVFGVITLVGTIRRQAPIDPTLALPGVRLGADRLPSERLPTHHHDAKRDPSGEFSGPFGDP